MFTQRIIINYGERMEKQAIIHAMATSTTAAKLSATAMTVGGGASVYGWFTVNEWCAVIGASAAVFFGFLTVMIRYKTYLLLKKDKELSKTN